MKDEKDLAEAAKRSLEDYGPGDACTICDSPVEGFGHCLYCGQRITDPITCTSCGRSVLRAGVCIDCIQHDDIRPPVDKPEPKQGDLL